MNAFKNPGQWGSQDTLNNTVFTRVILQEPVVEIIAVAGFVVRRGVARRRRGGGGGVPYFTATARRQGREPQVRWLMYNRRAREKK